MTFDDYENGGRALYAAFAQSVADVLQAALAEHEDTGLQAIQHRAKTVESLEVKLKKADARPETPIGDVAKDIAGCRLIFYTNGDIDRFRQTRILPDNFTVDYERSKMHYPDSKEDGAEFFISENWVVTLTNARAALPEYRRFAGLRCEIQIQTILDHAWAAMAHDTIYKPMTETGFGAAKVEAMRKRMRKVMQEHLQPAGFAFDKIASDYSQLKNGKAIVEGDALGAIRTCTDRNTLEEAVERFADYVLPNYNDSVAEAPAIIETLADAAIRAPAMPDVPHKAFHREYPGTRTDAVIARICRILEGGYLLYAAPDRLFDAVLAMRAAATSDDERRPIDDLTRRFAQHDLRAWKKVGPGLQRLLVDRIAGLTDAALLDATASVTIMLRETLSSTVTGTTWQADTVLLHSGSVAVTDNLKAVRSDALTQLERLHALPLDEPSRANTRFAMLAAGNTPNNATYTDLLGEVIMDDLTRVIGFFTGLFPGLGFESRRRIEVQLHRLYHSYHMLPPAMAENGQLVAAQARLLEAIVACRAALDSDPDFDRYRLFIGYDSIMPVMWAKPGFDFQAAASERSDGVDRLVATVSAETGDAWLARIEQFVEAPSEDPPASTGLEDFFRKLAKAQPEILLGRLSQLSDRLARWLPGMLHGLVEAGHGAAIDPVIETWVAEDRHLSSITFYLEFAKEFRVDLLSTITDKALANGDEDVLHNAATAAARQSTDHPDGLFDTIFLPAVTVLAARGLFGWVGIMANWDQLGLLKGLSAVQASQLLDLLVDMPQLGHGGEAMLAVLADEHVDAVIELIGRRFMHDRDTGDFRYEDLPYSLYFLKAPLAAAPATIVAAARRWYDQNPNFSEFRGGRLIAELFPNLEEPLQPLLKDQIDSGGEGIDFVLSVLRAYEGQDFLHPLLRRIVSRLPADDERLSILDIVIDSSGVLTGEYGSVEAQEARKTLVGEWESDEDGSVRAFAARFIKAAENQLAMERRRADRSVALRRIDYDD